MPLIVLHFSVTTPPFLSARSRAARRHSPSSDILKRVPSLVPEACDTTPFQCRGVRCAVKNGRPPGRSTIKQRMNVVGRSLSISLANAFGIFLRGKKRR